MRFLVLALVRHSKVELEIVFEASVRSLFKLDSTGPANQNRFQCKTKHHRLPRLLSSQRKKASKQNNQQGNTLTGHACISLIPLNVYKEINYRKPSPGHSDPVTILFLDTVPFWLSFLAGIREDESVRERERQRYFLFLSQNRAATTSGSTILFINRLVLQSKQSTAK